VETNAGVVDVGAGTQVGKIKAMFDEQESVYN
jgi:hypothetical protein